MIGGRRTLLAAAAALSLVIILVWGAAAPLGNSEGAAPAPPSRFNGLTMGTSYSVQYVAAFTAEQQQALEEEVGDLLFALDKEVFSTYAKDSELSRLNQVPQQIIYRTNLSLFNLFYIICGRNLMLTL